MIRSHCLHRLCPLSPFAVALLVVFTITACGDGGDGSTTSPVAGVVDACTTTDTAVCRGKANFNDRVLAGMGGNGRSCSDCHVESESFQLTPVGAHEFDRGGRSLVSCH